MIRKKEKPKTQMDSSSKLQRIMHPYCAIKSSLKSNCKGNDERKESSKMMKRFYIDKHETRKEEEDMIGLGKDMRISNRIAQNLATFNTIPRWEYQSKNNTKVRTNGMMGMSTRSSDVDMTIHNREDRNNNIVTSCSPNSDRDMTIKRREVKTNSMVMGRRPNSVGDMNINNTKHEEGEAIQEIMEELMHHRNILEFYLKQKKKLNCEKEEATTKGQCIFKKIELFLDSYEEEVMKITRQGTPHNSRRRGSDSTESSSSCITCSSITDRNMVDFDRVRAASKCAPQPRRKSNEKKRVSFGLPSTLNDSEEQDKKRGSSRGEIKGILRKNSFIYKQSLTNKCNKSLFLNEES